MATNLNRPSDFVSKINTHETASKQPILIPPSEFEKPKKLSDNKIQNAKDLIAELQQENERLKLQCCHNISQYMPFTTSHNEYADELIKHQSNEIAELKNEILKIQQLYQQDSEEWARKIELLEETQKQELKDLEKQFVRQEEDFHSRYFQAQSELQKTVEEASRESSNLKEILEKTRITLTTRIRELEDSLRKSETIISQLELELRNKSRIIEEQVHQVSKLKIYIGEAEQNNKPAQVWRVEKETVENRLKVAQAENQKLHSELELLDVRLKAFSDILAIQEAELSKAKRDGFNPAKQHELLLTRWREKVFSLLVQHRSGEIVSKNEINKSNITIVNLEEKIKSCEAAIEILKLSLTEKSAQLQIENSNRERLQTELDTLNKATVTYDHQAYENFNAMKCLTEFVETWFQKYEEKLLLLVEKSTQLKVLGQRVSFASSRMELIKAQLIRKTCIDGVIQNSTVSSVKLAAQVAPSNSDDLLQQELERVMKERDMLANQLKDDSTNWAEKLLHIKNQNVVETASLNETIEELTSDIHSKAQINLELSEEIDLLKDDLAVKNETLRQMETEISRYKQGIESVLAEQRLKDEEIWLSKQAELDRKLNDSKRELAKTVVSLRQSERNHAREIARLQELLQTTEDHLNKQLRNVQCELVRVEKEKNLMMGILKQEGLLHTLKTAREEPHRFDQENTNNNQLIHPILPQHLLANVGSKEDKLDISEPVQDVLNDLKSLAADLFDEQSEEEQQDF